MTYKHGQWCILCQKLDYLILWFSMICLTALESMVMREADILHQFNPCLPTIHLSDVAFISAAFYKEKSGPQSVISHSVQVILVV